jgi:hypothetical protein
MEIAEAELALFKTWSKGRDRFVKDGVVDERAFAAISTIYTTTRLEPIW